MKAKMFGIGLGIAVLLPLLSHMTVRFFREPPEWKDYYAYEPVQPSNISKAEAAQKNAEAKKKDDEFWQKMNDYNRFVFYFTYPLGLLALIIGTAARSSAVGAGLIFGGIFALTDGCFSAWEVMPGWVRYFALLILLILLAALGVSLERRIAVQRIGPSEAPPM